MLLSLHFLKSQFKQAQLMFESSLDAKYLLSNRRLLTINKNRLIGLPISQDLKYKFTFFPPHQQNHKTKLDVLLTQTLSVTTTI